MENARTRLGSGRVAAAAALAWLGLYVHNVADLPGQTLASPETGLPTLVTLALVVAWWQLPAWRGPLWLLFGWGLLNLVGGGLSVLPLPLLPFAPEQSARHYLFHAIYAAAQAPLVALTWARLRAGR